MNAARFFAALLVVVFHLRTLFVEDYASASNPEPFATVAYAVMSLGHQAVIVFFVLSGFWVGGSVIRSLRRGGFSAARYANARLVRLWLVLVPAIVLTLILDAVGRWSAPASDIYLGSSAYHALIPEEGIASRTSVLTAFGNLLFVQDVYVPTLGSNSPLWSLAVEFWYYLAFPAVLVLFWPGVARSTRISAGLVTLGAIVVLAAGPLTHGARVFELAPTWAAGAALAALRAPILVSLSRLSTASLECLRWVLGAAVLAAAVVDSRIWTTTTTYLLALLTAVWLATLIPDLRVGWVRRGLIPFSWAAGWSYSLYAIHLPVLALMAAMIVPTADERWSMNPTTALMCLGICAVPVGAAILFWLAFERNTDRFRHWMSRTRAKAELR